MNTATTIFTFQMICCALLFFMYIPQILKIGHNHSVIGISLPYNYIKMLLTAVSALVLELSSNNFIVIMAQYVSLALSGVVLVQIVYYLWKGNERKQIYSMIGVVSIFMIAIFTLLFSTNDKVLIIYVLQFVSFIVMFAQYIPQIHQLHKCKTVGDVSITHWVCKLVYTAFALGILVLSHNCLIVSLTQIFNAIFSLFILLQCIKYKMVMN